MAPKSKGVEEGGSLLCLQLCKRLKPGALGDVRLELSVNKRLLKSHWYSPELHGGLW